MKQQNHNSFDRVKTTNGHWLLQNCAEVTRDGWLIEDDGRIILAQNFREGSSEILSITPQGDVTSHYYISDEKIMALEKVKDHYILLTVSKIATKSEHHLQYLDKGFKLLYKYLCDTSADYIRMLVADSPSDVNYDHIFVSINYEENNKYKGVLNCFSIHACQHVWQYSQPETILDIIFLDDDIHLWSLCDHTLLNSSGECGYVEVCDYYYSRVKRDNNRQYLVKSININKPKNFREYILIELKADGTEVEIYRTSEHIKHYTLRNDCIVLVTHTQLVYLRNNQVKWHYQQRDIDENALTITENGEVILPLDRLIDKRFSKGFIRVIKLSASGEINYQRDIIFDSSLGYLASTGGHIYEIGCIVGMSRIVKCDKYNNYAWTVTPFDESNTDNTYFVKSDSKKKTNQRIEAEVHDDDPINNYAAIHLIVNNDERNNTKINQVVTRVLAIKDIELNIYSGHAISIYHEMINLTNCEDMAFRLCQAMKLPVLCQSTVEDQLLVVSVYNYESDDQIHSLSWQIDGLVGRIDDIDEELFIEMVNLPSAQDTLKKVLKLTSFSKIIKAFSEKLSLPFSKRG